jgi:hypothetical protein
MYDQLLRRLREWFRPEFLNRIDEIIIFRQPAATSSGRSPSCCCRRPAASCAPRT